MSVFLTQTFEHSISIKTVGSVEGWTEILSITNHYILPRVPYTKPSRLGLAAV